MNITLILTGKTDNKYISEGVDVYLKRLKHYINFETKIIPDLKNTKKLSEDQQKIKEGELILSRIKNTDILILFDEKGKEFASVGFAQFIEKKMISGTKNLVFIIGGAYGFSQEVYKRANGKLALSKMTFSHQMVRLIAVEQIYRAMTILKGEPYHHQ